MPAITPNSENTALNIINISSVLSVGFMLTFSEVT
jgi:hypothetical protein